MGDGSALGLAVYRNTTIPDPARGRHSVADDFIGLIIIALAYADPLKPVRWLMLLPMLLVFAACTALR